MRDDDKQTVKIELLSQWKLEAEFRNYEMVCSSLWYKGNTLTNDKCQTRPDQSKPNQTRPKMKRLLSLLNTTGCLWRFLGSSSFWGKVANSQDFQLLLQSPNLSSGLQLPILECACQKAAFPPHCFSQAGCSRLTRVTCKSFLCHWKILLRRWQYSSLKSCFAKLCHANRPRVLPCLPCLVLLITKVLLLQPSPLGPSPFFLASPAPNY